MVKTKQQEGITMINITGYEVLGKLPDPFLFRDGSRVKNMSDWEKRRQEIDEDVRQFQFGSMPPEPEFLEVIATHTSANNDFPTYQIVTGRRACPVRFNIYISLPEGCAKKQAYPVAIDGDLCYLPLHRHEQNTKPFPDNGVAFVKFNRCELVYDNHRGQPRTAGFEGPLYDCYPDAHFSCIAGWAWGYHRVVDALEKLGFWEAGKPLAFTGCSRGAKTALLAGLTDQRATIINPVETCACGASCYRVHMTAICSDGNPARSETLHDQWNNYGSWLGDGMGQYADDEASLPFDAHTLLSLAAPRMLLIGNAEDDIWGNPLGAYQTAIATREVYDLYGQPEKIAWYWRKGVHGHEAVDFETLLQVMLHEMNGSPMPERLYKLPFDAPEAIYDWKCPTKD